MKNSNLERPQRISFEVTREQKMAIDKVLRWGMGAPFWRIITDDIICLLSDEETRDRVIALVMSGKIKPVDWSSLFIEDKDG